MGPIPATRYDFSGLLLSKCCIKESLSYIISISILCDIYICTESFNKKIGASMQPNREQNWRKTSTGVRGVT